MSFRFLKFSIESFFLLRFDQAGSLRPCPATPQHRRLLLNTLNTGSHSNCPSTVQKMRRGTQWPRISMLNRILSTDKIQTLQMFFCFCAQSQSNCASSMMCRGTHSSNFEWNKRQLRNGKRFFSEKKVKMTKNEYNGETLVTHWHS